MASSGVSVPSDGLKVFVSYSRANMKFADQIVIALRDLGFQPMIDRHDIDPGEKWKDRLRKLIIGADIVVFILTDTSAGSPICAWEVQESLERGKRIVPILPMPLGVAAPAALSELNYIHFYAEDAIPDSGFYTGLQKLSQFLKEDTAWLREATRYGELAATWAAKDYNEDHLLQGVALADAQQWIASKPPEAEVADLTRRFVLESSRAEEARAALSQSQIAEREAALATAEEATTARARIAKRIRNISVTAIAGAALLIVLAGYSLVGAIDGISSTNALRQEQFLVEIQKVESDPTKRMLMALSAISQRSSSLISRKPRDVISDMFGLAEDRGLRTVMLGDASLSYLEATYGRDFWRSGELGGTRNAGPNESILGIDEYGERYAAFTEDHKIGFYERDQTDPYHVIDYNLLSGTDAPPYIWRGDAVFYEILFILHQLTDDAAQFVEIIENQGCWEEYDIGDGQTESRINYSTCRGVEQFALAPDGSFVWFIDVSGRMAVQDLQTGEREYFEGVQIEQSRYEIALSVTAMAVHPDLELGLLLTDSGKLEIWDLPGRKRHGAANLELSDTEDPWPAKSAAIAIAPNGGAFAIRAKDFVVAYNIGETDDGALHISYKPRAWIIGDNDDEGGFKADTKTLTFSHDSSLLATNGASNGIHIFCTRFFVPQEETQRKYDPAFRGISPLIQLAGHNRYIKQLAFSRDNKKLISLSADGTAKAWGLEGEVLADATMTFDAGTGENRKKAVSHLTLDPGGDRVLTYRGASKELSRYRFSAPGTVEEWQVEETVIGLTSSDRGDFYLRREDTKNDESMTISVVDIDQGTDIAQYSYRGEADCGAEFSSEPGALSEAYYAPESKRLAANVMADGIGPDGDNSCLLVWQEPSDEPESYLLTGIGAVVIGRESVFGVERDEYVLRNEIDPGPIAMRLLEFSDGEVHQRAAWRSRAGMNTLHSDGSFALIRTGTHGGTGLAVLDAAKSDYFTDPVARFYQGVFWPVAFNYDPLGKEPKYFVSVGYDGLIRRFRVDPIIYASPAEQIEYACTKLYKSGAPLRITDGDIAEYPVLRTGAREPCKEMILAKMDSKLN